MIDYIKNVLGVTVTDYDTYLVIICAVALMWIIKSVVSAVQTTLLHIFY